LDIRHFDDVLERHQNVECPTAVSQKTNGSPTSTAV